MRGKSFTAPVEGGQVSGWVDGAGVPVLLLHGGPGLSYGYLDDLAVDLGDGYEIAAYQQRGIAPSMIEGPYDVETHLDDVAAVLDVLGWQMAYVVGHSWGGHLAFHVAVAMPERLLGVLTVDPLGAVGDGGGEIFGQAMGARLPADIRKRAEELDERAMAGKGTEEESLESLRLYWPAYFADFEHPPPMPPLSMSVEAYAKCWESLQEQLPALEASLPSISVPVGIIAGAAGPMPVAESADATAARIPGAWVAEMPDAGHLPWFESPGCVRAGLDRLAGV